MKIRNRKLSKDAIQTLRRIPVELCRSYDVLVAPVYVYLPKNEKFVAIKFPLQYFSPAELEKFRPYESFYLPEFVDFISPFQKAGESVRALFDVRQKRPVKTSQGSELITLPMPQHELDDAVLHLLAPLWSDGARVEPFFLCFFTNEVCLAFAPEVLSASLDKSTDLFELALLRASCAVFLALHIGYSDAKTLTQIREKVFSDTMNESTATGSSSEVSLLEQLIWEAIPNTDVKEISMARIKSVLQSLGSGGKVARKLLSRLSRIDLEFIHADTKIASLYGEKGICDV